MVCAGCVFVAGIHPSRTWTSGSFESMRWNACMHRLGRGLYSHPKEFWGNGVRTHADSKAKIPSTGKKFFPEGNQTHSAASSSRAWNSSRTREFSRNWKSKSLKKLISVGKISASILFVSRKIKMIDLWMQIEDRKLIFIMNFSVLHFFKFASRMPQIAQILVSTYKIFGGEGMPPDPPRNFPFFSISNSSLWAVQPDQHTTNELFRPPLPTECRVGGCWGMAGEGGEVGRWWVDFTCPPSLTRVVKDGDNYSMEKGRCMFSLQVTARLKCDNGSRGNRS